MSATPMASPEVAKLLHKLQGQLIKEATAPREAEPGEVVLPSPRFTQHEYSDSGAYRRLESSDGKGNSVRLQSAHEPDPDPSHKMHRPWIWYGQESRTDAQGRTWSRSLGYHVMDDFGSLVKVPA